MKKTSVLALVLLSIMVFIGSYCNRNEVQQSLSGAEQVTTMFRVPKNSQGHTVEQQNIVDRLKVTTDPTNILWIHLISLDGKIIKRMPVKNKVTSSGKRLEPRKAVPTYNSGYMPDVVGTPYETDELIQPDGTFGESDYYIYWFDTLGRYHQWGTAGGLGYLLTNYPIDLRDPVDEVTGLYNAHKAASEWQKEQESLLKKQEGK